MKTIEITDENFEQIVLTSNKTVLVDFSAEWCGPCKIMGPVVEMLADQLQEIAIVGKLDVDLNPKVTAKYTVRNMPTFLIFKDGNVADRVIGAMPGKVLDERVRSVAKQLRKD